MRNYKTELVVAVICASFVPFGYIAWKAKNQEVKNLQAELKEHDTPAPVVVAPSTVCQDNDAKNVHCFFYRKLDEAEELGAKRTIDRFRNCKRIHVQGEDESLQHFYKRSHFTKGSCVIFRETLQPDGGCHIHLPDFVPTFSGNFGEVFTPCKPQQKLSEASHER